MKSSFVNGVMFGIIVVITMKCVPIFHGFDSNDVKRIIFEDEDGKSYMLIPKETECVNRGLRVIK